MAGLAGLGVAGASTLAACGGSSTGASGGGSSSGGSADHGDLAIQLSWIKNIEFAGEFFADSKGYYKDAGFSSVNLIAGGSAGTSAEAAVTSGKALVGLSSPTLTAPAINEGAPLKIIGTTFQKNAFCIVSLDSNPIPDPAAMKGKKIGVQSGGNEQIFSGLLKANGIDPSSLTIVPVQYDPTVVTTGEVDGFMAYLTNEPILLQGKRFKTVQFAFADHGLPLVTETFTVAQQTIEEDRDKLKAFLKAEVLGWTDALNNPDEGAKLAVDQYGKELKLNLEEQLKEINAQATLIVTDDTVKNGLFTMTDELIATNIESLATAGTTITAEKLFDLSLLEEVYSEDPSLVTGPTLTPEAAASAAPA
ncbi:ABC transporter substrate-binding protein [Quadrisphaera oryzae]|uniref:ABC transporter substrate-binding protein n=1 Tax=Quadrisphaera TaxID=317661 RepID=UPI0016463942|nr:ABC transporter substrate-binding protein [Quadrisphaera sp. RL12-1S]MBC3760268.1 ABC transporter substrate-binding protein [Quadrisphaera sp. RL12-1S]